MNAAQLLARWRAAAGPWANFLKPSLLTVDAEPAEVAEPPVYELRWVPEGWETAVVLDLPGLDAIAHGVALGRRGWCVVPMFNVTHDAGNEAVPTDALISALHGAAPDLPARPSGPPVFLLDAARQRIRLAPLRPGDFDNRWYVYPSDFPSAAQFTETGVRRILVVTAGAPADDLRDSLGKLAALEVLLVSPAGARASPFPAPRAKVLRGVAELGRMLSHAVTSGRVPPPSHG